MALDMHYSMKCLFYMVASHVDVTGRKSCAASGVSVRCLSKQAQRNCLSCVLHSKTLKMFTRTWKVFHQYHWHRYLYSQYTVYIPSTAASTEICS